MLATIAPALDAIIQLAVVFILALTPILVRWGTKYLEKKLHINFAAEQEAKITALIDKGIHYAAESAQKHLKTDKEPVDKLGKAIAFITAEAERMGIQSVVETQAEHLADMIESRLGVKRHDPEDQMDATPNGK